jgi:hypothetical protein
MKSHLCVIMALCAVVFALPVSAAEPARDLASMRVALDAEVYVRTSNGAEIRGRFVRASTQALVITRSDGRETMLTSEQVTIVWKRGDGLRNGAIIGGLVGLASGVLGQSQCTDCSSEVAIGVGLGVPIWAGVGALIDRQHVGRTVIYRAP